MDNETMVESLRCPCCGNTNQNDMRFYDEDLYSCDEGVERSTEIICRECDTCWCYIERFKLVCAYNTNP